MTMLGTVFVLLYAAIAAAAILMTLREHRLRPARRRLVDLGAGIAACLAWPVLATAVLWELARRPA